MEIVIGSRVRVFDGTSHATKGDAASFTDGIVTGIVVKAERLRYQIEVTRRVLGGRECPVRPGKMAFPPINGTPLDPWTFHGAVTNGVVAISNTGVNPKDRLPKTSGEPDPNKPPRWKDRHMKPILGV